MKISDLLNNLIEQVNNDENLDQELRDSIVQLIFMATADPKPDYLRAVAIVVEKLAENANYLSALETIKNFEFTPEETVSGQSSPPPEK